MKKELTPADWGLQTNERGEMMLGDFSAVDLAKTYGTPLHVLNEGGLEETAREFRESVSAVYPYKTSVHYAFKCNAVPAVVQSIRKAGLKAEVMSPFELELALHLGYRGADIIVNGPCKQDSFLRQCLEKKVRLIVVDSIEELQILNQICINEKKHADILLRINPGYTPRGMNSGAATGSRKGCAFGLDLKGGEAAAALDIIKEMKRIHFMGFHFHIGTGIRYPRDYSKALQCLAPLLVHTHSAGFKVKILDIGGGFASMTTREMTSRELLIYQGFERLPAGIKPGKYPCFEDFAREIVSRVLDYFPKDQLPELIYEPGRCIVSPNQVLLLTVHRVKERPGVRKWLITDGGLGTVSMPTYYEYHEVFLCNDVTRPRSEKVTIIGPVCFASDIVYRNKPMPRVNSGEVLAIMDSGAYFTAMESSFGFARPAIAAFNHAAHRLVRRAETFADMIHRDLPGEPQRLHKAVADRKEEKMKFAVIRNDTNPLRDKIADEVIRECLQKGHQLSNPENNIKFVLNLTSIESPQFFRRRSQGIFVFSLVLAENPGEDLRSLCYTTLVHTLSNMVLCVVPTKEPTGSQHEIHCITPEGGFYHFPFEAEKVYKTIIPIAGAHFAIKNEFSEDLPLDYWQSSPVVEELKEYAKELDKLGVLPTPFPLKEVLSEENIKHLYNLFEMKGLSYGNLSARERIPELGEATFWMTARGVNKAEVSEIGKELLLIKGFDYERGKALVSVPPGYDRDARVSVDAVEHELIYRTFPGVGAIVHVHAWLEGVLCTRQNYPCGTRELAEEVVSLLQQTDNPAKTAVGLKNHGLTITGPNLEDIFKQIRGKLLLQVPMFA